MSEPGSTGAGRTAEGERSAGLLLHPTSLPGRYGIGGPGSEAERFLDWARDAGQSWWQVLPLGPPAEGNSPYSALSAFAGNPLLISPDLLVRDGLLAPEDVAEVPAFPDGKVDFDLVSAWKDRLLRRSWELFERRAPRSSRDELEGFAEAPDQRAWLDDWTLYSALRLRHQRRGWWHWPPALAHRDAGVLAEARRAESPEVAFQTYLQFLFRRQWSRLRRIAGDRGLQILGDLPIYVALDSADVWAHRELFDLDARGRPRAVAGVPPDGYSDTGQLWGNPLYRWDRILDAGNEGDGLRWWSARLRANLELCDRLRIDHFRGFAGYWRVPADAETAAAGEWVEGPGRPLFDALRAELGDLPLVAEDLGVITADVDELRDGLGLPGMKVLQFAFGEDGLPHLPENIVPACVVYTGTHDNDTTVGWFRSLEQGELQRLEDCLGQPGDAGDIHWQLIELAYESAAETAMIPVQDVLGLDREARMNTPAVADGNWSWRLRPSQLTPALARRLRALAETHGRSTAPRS